MSNSSSAMSESDLVSRTGGVRGGGGWGELVEARGGVRLDEEFCCTCGPLWWTPFLEAEPGVHLDEEGYCTCGPLL